MRKAIAFVCVAAIVFAAFAPAASAAVAFAVLVPLGPLFGLVLVGPAAPVVETAPAPFPTLEAAGSRPPPSFSL